MPKIFPLVLAGGLGTRLWPLSRKSYPKQFAKLFKDTTLFQHSALRTNSTDEIAFEPHIILTNYDFRFIVNDQLKEVGVTPGHIIIEPISKNTAPAILAASLFANKLDPEAILLVTPSDHLIPDRKAFHSSIALGLEQIKKRKLVTFGIAPTYPETGYGYLELTESMKKPEGVSRVVKFVEKPDLNSARKMLNAGNFMWNAGIFLFKAEDIVAEFEKFSPKTLGLVKDALTGAKTDLNFLSLNTKHWEEIEGESIDYAIMEKAKNLVTVALPSNWSDVGDWGAVWSESTKDISGVALSNNAHSIECKNTLLRSENTNQQIVGLGLENILAIAMPDAVLIANKDRAQDVKKVVNQLNAKKVTQAETFPKDHRPWGWFESLAFDNRFQVKRICVKPGAALSLQSHKRRSEHWIVVEGEAKVTVDKEVKTVTEGQSVYVPSKVIHRLENDSKKMLVVIEVQTGSYLGEDDIIRFDDIYARK